MAASSARGREEAAVKEGRRITIHPSQDPVLLAGVSAEDERFSWRAALAAMLALSAVASLGFVFSLNPFAISFNIAFVYLPTVILIVGPYVTRTKRKTGGFASSQAG